MTLLGRRIKVAYGFGQVANGVEDAATNLFALFFFSQVLGVPAWAVGFGMGLSLLLDALTDPLMGSWSDGFRHRWGRRHPFLVGSAVPLGLTFVLLFTPPALGATGLAVWAIGGLVALRLAFTVFFVPHLALGAELSDDYDERTRIVAFRVFFTYLGAAVFVAVGRAFFFRPSEAYPNGQLDPSAYAPMALSWGVVIILVVLVSAAGTWSVIPRLARPSATAPFGLGRLVHEQRAALSHRGFRVLIASLLLFFVARGTALALDLYMGTYFWGLGSDAVILPGFALLGLLVGAPAFSLVAPRIEKRTSFLIGMALYAVLTMAPPLLKIVGLFPSGAALRPTLFLVLFASGVVGAAAVIAAGSMLADIADEHEVATGHRSEGLFFGASSFARKAATGVGGALGGVFLSLVAFPTQAAPGEVSPALVTALGLAAGPGVAIFGLLGFWIATRYRGDRRAHEETMAALMKRAATPSAV